MDAAGQAGAAEYRIRVRGHLDARWSAWFDGLKIGHEPGGATILTGPVADQAALYGLLSRLRDLNLVLLAVVRCPPTRSPSGRGTRRRPADRPRHAQVVDAAAGASGSGPRSPSPTAGLARAVSASHAPTTKEGIQ